MQRKIQCKEELWQKVMNIYKQLANSQVCTKVNIVLNSQNCIKAVLNKLFNAFYRLVICGFILEKSFFMEHQCHF